MVRRKILQVGNICALCEETYPRSLLYTCYICGMTYCGNCVILEDNKIICLRCAVKRISPKAPRSKYSGLGILLSKRGRTRKEIRLSFNEIEETIGGKLPASAYKHEEWWINGKHTPSEIWSSLGWKVKEVDLEEGTVTFIKEKQSAEGENLDKHVTSRRVSQEFKVLALRARSRIRKPTKISKSKIAILQARLKNIERARRLKRKWLKPL